MSRPRECRSAGGRHAERQALRSLRLITRGYELPARRELQARNFLVPSDRAGHLVRQQLEDAATAWATEGRDKSALYSGGRLEVARSWAADPARAHQMSPSARDFLGASERRRRRDIRVRKPEWF